MAGFFTWWSRHSASGELSGSLSTASSLTTQSARTGNSDTPHTVNDGPHTLYSGGGRTLTAFPGAEIDANPSLCPTSSKDALHARFWGVRGSYPTPLASGSRIGGNTTCLEARFGRNVVIIDAGTGAIGLGETLAREYHEQPLTAKPTLTMLFTHAHHDHLSGLPFFAPLYEKRARIHMFGPDLAGLRFEDTIAGYMRSPYFPVDFRQLPSHRQLTSIGDGARLVWPLDGAEPVLSGERSSVTPQMMTVDVLHSQQHPREGTLVYRVSAGGRSLVFATDVEMGAPDKEPDQRFITFAEGADVLVHDAQYNEDDYFGSGTYRGFGHSTPLMAANSARAAHVGKLILFHHNPGYNDASVRAMEQAARTTFPDVVAAHEGLEITLDGATSRHV